MDTVEYVLCRWKWNLWPAKVLSRIETPATKCRRKTFDLEVQILSVNERVKVKSTEVMELTEAGIETIAFCTGVRLRITDPPRQDAQWKAFTPPGQARSYRKALRLALDILSCRKLAEQQTTRESTNTGPKGGKLHPDHGNGSCPGRKHHTQKLHHGSNPKKQRHCISESSSVNPKLPTPIGAVLQCMDKTMSGMSSSHTVPWQSKYSTVEFPGLFMQPVVILPKFSPLRMKTKSTCRENPVSEAHKSTAFPDSMEDPGESSLNAGLERARASSVSSNSRLPDSFPAVAPNSKHQDPVLKKGAKVLEVPEHSTESKAMVTKESTGRRQQGRTESVAPEGMPPPMERGTLVWCKAQGHPFWPSVVKCVSQTTNTARVLLIEANMNTEESGVPVHLCNLKHLECEEKDALVREASKAHSLGVTWCFSLIRHYREEITWGTFQGSFLDYFASNVSYPVREALEETDLYVDFPTVNYSILEDFEEETNLDESNPLVH
ncbi:PWWP domain-containing DNA repair factor 4-like isoform 1-T4 [Thomomys bottae]